MERFEARFFSESSPPSLTLTLGPNPVRLSPAELGDVLVRASAADTRVEHNAEARVHLTSGKGALKVWPRRFHVSGGVGLGVCVLALLLVLGAWCHPNGSRGTSGVGHPSTHPWPDRPVLEEMPPCGPKMVAKEIDGGCWIPIAQQPPCGKGVAEYQGRCYLPSAKHLPMPQAAEP